MKIELEFYKFEDLSKKVQKKVISKYRDTAFDEWLDFHWAKPVERDFEREFEMTFTLKVRHLSLAKQDSWYICDDVDMVSLSVFPLSSFWDDFEYISDYKEVRQFIKKYIKKTKALRKKLQSDNDKVVARIKAMRKLYHKDGSIFIPRDAVGEAAWSNCRIEVSEK